MKVKAPRQEKRGKKKPLENITVECNGEDILISSNGNDAVKNVETHDECNCVKDNKNNHECECSKGNKVHNECDCDKDNKVHDECECKKEEVKVIESVDSENLNKSINDTSIEIIDVDFTEVHNGYRNKNRRKKAALMKIKGKVKGKKTSVLKQGKKIYCEGMDVEKEIIEDCNIDPKLLRDDNKEKGKKSMSKKVKNGKEKKMESAVFTEMERDLVMMRASEPEEVAADNERIIEEIAEESGVVVKKKNKVWSKMKKWGKKIVAGLAVVGVAALVAWKFIRTKFMRNSEVEIIDANSNVEFASV